MRQRRLIKLLRDYDCVIRYHPGKTNVVADALSKNDKEPNRVRAMVVTVHDNLPEQIQNAQVEACKADNNGAEGFLGEGEPLKLDPMCLTCAKVKVEHQKPSGWLQQPEIPFKMEKLTWLYLKEIVCRHRVPSERTIQTLEDILRACMINFGSDWDKHLPLAEFSY
ncbi:hypothetical protein Tco_1068826, partial [Tanacetum coccineum]